MFGQASRTIYASDDNPAAIAPYFVIVNESLHIPRYRHLIKACKPDLQTGLGERCKCARNSRHCQVRCC